MTPEEKTSEAQLTARFRAGDVSAFGPLCALLQRPLFSYLMRHVQNRPDAEDLLQETLMRLYRMACEDQLAMHDSVRPVVFTIAHNLAVDHLRRSSLRRTEPMHENDPAPNRSDGPAAQALLRDQIALALDRLPEQQRSALLLREYGELSYAEIAETIEVSLESVKISIYRARKRLGELLDREGQYVGQTDVMP